MRQASTIAGGDIRIDGISKSFDVAGGRHNVLNKVELTVERGSFVSILGASGCGKSTLLQIVAGLQPADSGSVLLGGKAIGPTPPEMLYLFQQYSKSILPWRTVRGNIAFGMESRGRWSRKEIDERCTEMIQLVGLQGCDDYYPRQLSGGMQQRVAIARALACEPQVLLMDEPFSAVDAMTRASLQDLALKIWADTGLTMLFVTHDIEEAVYLSSQVVVLHRSPRNLALQMPIDLPYPRDHLTTPEQPAFIRARHQLYEAIYEAERMGAH